MRIFAPAVEVRLVKASRRSRLVEGMAAASRYAKLDSINLTPFLGDSGSVRTSKSVREPAGTFDITLSDAEYRDAAGVSLDTIYALVEPMDLVEIRFCRNKFDYSNPGDGYRPPVVMRGLVGSVSRGQDLSSGRPARSITISGRDFGRVLQLLQIFFLNNSVVGDNLLTELAFFHKYAEEGQAKIKTAKEFVQDVVDKVINPYLARLTQLANGDAVGAKVVNKWSANVSISGAVSPYSVAKFNNVSLHQMLASLLDVGPFNELFVEDRQDGVRLTVRPAPFLDVSGQPIQGVRPDVLKISYEDVDSSSLSRSDDGVANYYWVSNDAWSMYSNEDAKRLASVGPESSYILYNYQNVRSDLYGIRKMEVSTTLLPESYSGSDSARAEQIPSNTGALTDWLVARREVLAKVNRDNVLFEFGSLRLRGNELVKPGTMLDVLVGADGVLLSSYVTKVDHEIVPFVSFTTTATVERGTSFIRHAGSERSLYRYELGLEGVR